MSDSTKGVDVYVVQANRDINKVSCRISILETLESGNESIWPVYRLGAVSHR